jgi:hypothetical protein
MKLCVIVLFAAVAGLVRADPAREGMAASKAPTISMPGSSWWSLGTSKAAVNKELLEAAQSGNLKDVQRALDKGADIHARDAVRWWRNWPHHSASRRVLRLR